MRMTGIPYGTYYDAFRVNTEIVQVSPSCYSVVSLSLAEISYRRRYRRRNDGNSTRFRTLSPMKNLAFMMLPTGGGAPFAICAAIERIPRVVFG